MKGFKLLWLITGLILLSPIGVYAKDEPQVQVSETSYDVGQMYENEKITHIYEFKNIGKAILKVHKAKTFCNCTTPEVLNKEVAPGETGSVKVVLDASKLKERGKITRSLTIWTNDPKNPEVTFQIVAEILSEVDVSPKFLNFGEINNRKPVTRKLVVTFASQKVLKILKIESSSKNIKIKALPMKNVNKILVCEIEVTIDKNLPPGRLAEYVTIFTDSQINPVIKKLVVANITEEKNNLIGLIKKRITS